MLENAQRLRNAAEGHVKAVAEIHDASAQVKPVGRQEIQMDEIAVQTDDCLGAVSVDMEQERRHEAEVQNLKCELGGLKKDKKFLLRAEKQTFSC